ncbi:Histidine kinase [Dokdonia pacifica]|uniref:Histidine kinase n=1 Tax=Dokdonia pacifica TaxID=1627892 RepID=A0A239D6M8_9FLAO|nr:Histidine kinase [Dokdonia pacifica]
MSLNNTKVYYLFKLYTYPYFVYKKLFILLSICIYTSCSHSKKEPLHSAKLTTILSQIDSLPAIDRIYALRNFKDISSLPDSTKTIYYDYLANAYVTEKKYDSAIVFFQKELTHIKQPIDTEKEAVLYYKLWDLYRIKGELGNQIAITTDFEEQLSPSLDIGLVHLNYLKQSNNEANGNYKEASNNNILRIKVLKKLVDKDSTNSLFKERLRLALLDKAHITYLYLRDKKQSFATLDSLITIKDLTPNTAQLLYTNYGVYQYHEGDKEKSLSLYKKGVSAMKMLDKNAFDVPNTIAVGYANIAEVLIDLKQFESAKKYLDTLATMGIHTLEESLQRNILKYQLRLQIDSEGRYGNTTALLDTLSKYQDQAYRKKFSKELVSLTAAKEKQQELSLKNQQAEFEKRRFKTITWSIGILSIIAIFVFVWFRRYREQQKELLMQQRLLRAQMNPHFTFNALYSIQSLIKTDSVLAIKYLNHFSKLLRSVLENSMANYVPIEDELQSIVEYIELQQLRFPKRFTYSIQNELPEDCIDIPSMLIQPFVENAIEHGFADITYEGVLLITLSRKHKKLFCIIEDNGSGIQEGNRSKKSASIQLIKDFISKKTKTAVTIQANTASSSKTGVIVMFQLPYKLYTND